MWPLKPHMHDGLCIAKLIMLGYNICSLCMDWMFVAIASLPYNIIFYMKGYLLRKI